MQARPAGRSVATGYRCAPSLPRAGTLLSGLQRFQVVPIAGPLARPLHRPQMTQGTDADQEALDLDIRCLSVEDGEGRDLREALKDVDLTQFSNDERPR